MATLSLCMIVRNEEKWLSQCLDAAKPFVDEIIVVDTGSSDSTMDIARRFGATVVETPWEHDFSKAKNVALENATKDWILVLDADERVAAEDFKRLRTLMDASGVDAFRLELRNYVPKAGIGCVSCVPSDMTMQSRAYRPIKLVRLFRNMKGFRYEHRVHEMIENSIETAHGTISDGSIPIHHYGILHATNLRHKMRYYAWLVMKELEEHPDNVRALFMAGQFHHEQGKLDKALDHFMKAAKLSPPYKNVWFSIAGIHLEQHSFESAMHAYEQSLLNNPDSPNAPMAVNNLAVLYGNAGRHDDARKLLEIAVKKFPNDAAIRKNAERFGLTVA
ncbi:glycosyltransferase [Candidatus Woesearchaeota archaeon]|nr:glycosyltransferase [Candidatus Woesearchaeota archaeon]